MSNPTDKPSYAPRSLDTPDVRTLLSELREAMTGKISAGTPQQATALTPSTSPITEKKPPERTV